MEFYKQIYADDLILDKPYHRGQPGPQVTLIQEWLCLHGIHVVIDGKFGPATEKAVRIFQNVIGIIDDGIVGYITFTGLIRPMTDALLFEPSKLKSPGDIVVECAGKHLAQHPKEIGGDNKGPWVRLYLDGLQGVPWCAGFVSFILKQAAFSINDAPPLKPSFSCDLLAKNAKLKNLFFNNPNKRDRLKIRPGSLFLQRVSEADWNHTGIVTKTEDELFHSIEGNSNDSGGSGGYEVCRRIRGYDKKDFILIR
jgi:hypothetical protein